MRRHGNRGKLGMRGSKGTVLAAVVALCSVAASAPAQASPASDVIASGTDECDWLPDNDAVGDSGSEEADGRTVTLYTAKLSDAYAKAAIEGGVERGDEVWIDRSTKLFDMGSEAGHPDTEWIRDNEGWKQCGPFSATWWNAAWNYRETATVALQSDGKSYAVRACMRPHDADDSTCTAWFIDHT